VSNCMMIPPGLSYFANVYGATDYAIMAQARQ
jgi:hypothetical protein